MFKAEDFTNVIKFILNRSIDEFVEMYKSLGFISKAYAEEKWQKARNYFAIWWCEIDETTQIRIIEYVKKFYGKE